MLDFLLKMCQMVNELLARVLSFQFTYNCKEGRGKLLLRHTHLDEQKISIMTAFKKPDQVPTKQRNLLINCKCTVAKIHSLYPNYCKLTFVQKQHNWGDICNFCCFSFFMRSDQIRQSELIVPQKISIFFFCEFCYQVNCVKNQEHHHRCVSS